MWHYGCATCLTVVRVIGDVEEYQRLIVGHPQWHAGRPCFIEGCHGKMSGCLPDAAAHAHRFMELTPEQFFRALCGGGTPAEVDVREEQVRELFLSSKTVSVDLHTMMGDHRVILDRLHLDNGTTLHFAGTGAGALIYKVTKHE